MSVVELVKPTGKEDALKSLGEIVERVNELSRSGRFTEDEKLKLVDGLKDVNEKLVRHDDIIRANARTFDPGNPLASLDGLVNRIPADDGIPAGYYNAMVLAADELRGASDLGQFRFAATWGGLAERMGARLSDPLAGKLNELKRINDCMVYADALMARGGTTIYGAADRQSRMRSLKLWKQWEKLSADFQRQLDTATAGEGGNWVPTILSDRLIDLIQPELRVANLLIRLAMPGKNFDLPVSGGDVVGFFVGEATAEAGPAGALIPISNLTTNKVSLVAKKLATRVLASSEILEDMVVAAEPLISMQIAKALGRALEDALLNGDDAATHQDNDVTAATDRRKIWDGLRRIALDAAANRDAGGAGAFEIADVWDVKKQMGTYGAIPGQGAWIVGYKGAIEMMRMAEVVTLEKFGPSATVLTGQIAALAGSPVILSEFVREDVAATGVNTLAGPNTLTYALYVNREAFTLGERRGITLLADRSRYIEFDQWLMIGSWRGDFKPYYGGTAKAVGIIRNFS